MCSPPPGAPLPAAVLTPSRPPRPRTSAPLSGRAHRRSLSAQRAAWALRARLLSRRGACTRRSCPGWTDARRSPPASLRRRRGGASTLASGARPPPVLVHVFVRVHRATAGSCGGCTLRRFPRFGRFSAAATPTSPLAGARGPHPASPQCCQHSLLSGFVIVQLFMVVLLLQSKWLPCLTFIMAMSRGLA